MNTVMDNNKQLCLINGDRIAMGQYHSMVFEVQDLAVASPATVSRAGMVYVDAADLGYKPAMNSWLQTTFDSDPVREFFKGLFEKYVERSLEFCKRFVSELVPQTDFSRVQSLFNLFSALYNDASLGISTSGIGEGAQGEGNAQLLEKWFVFCVVWTIGGSADEAGRIKFNDMLREIEPIFPPPETVYDYFVDVKENDWKVWKDKVQANWRPPKDAQFFKLIVPTLDTVRNGYIVNTVIRRGIPVLLSGNTGTGKTVLAERMLNGLPSTH